MGTTTAVRRFVVSLCAAGKDHECSHRQDHHKPYNLLNTLRGIETRATRTFPSCR
jgi:hypothetical protein